LCSLILSTFILYSTLPRLSLSVDATHLDTLPFFIFRDNTQFPCTWSFSRLVLSALAALLTLFPFVLYRFRRLLFYLFELAAIYFAISCSVSCVIHFCLTFFTSETVSLHASIITSTNLSTSSSVCSLASASLGFSSQSWNARHLGSAQTLHELITPNLICR